jgi:hypothetical protein
MCYQKPPGMNAYLVSHGSQEKKWFSCALAKESVTARPRKASNTAQTQTRLTRSVESQSNIKKRGFISMTPDPVFPVEQDSEQAKLASLMSAINDERADNSLLLPGCLGDCREDGTPVQVIAA